MKKFAFGLGLILSFVSLSFLSACTGKKPAENTLRLPMIADAKSLDPIYAEDTYSAEATSMIYEGLLEYHYLKRPHTLQPLLADAMPDVSADGLTYTFKVKKGVKFMDHAAFAGGKGRDITAKDFVYSWMRLADPKLNSPGFWVFDGHIKGLNEWRDKSKDNPDYNASIEGLQAPNDETLVIKLKHKYPQLLFVLAMPYTFAVPREVVEKLGKDFVNTPVGTGPYRLTNWMRNSKLSFERNPAWRGQPYPSEGEAGDAEKGLLTDAGKNMPFADKVELMVFVESQPMWLNFMSGNVDRSAIPKDNYKAAVDEKTKELLPELTKKGMSLYKAPEPDVTYTAFNMEDPAIKKGGKELRHALSLAMDKLKTIEMFRNGRAVLAHTPVPPNFAGYDENFKNPYSEYDVEKAKQLLAKAGYPGGKGLPELTYEISQGSDSRQMAEKLQKEWAAIGVNLKISVNQFSELTEKINRKKAQMWGIAWLADYPDAENFLQLLYGPNKSPSPNGSNFDNPEYNKLYEQIRGMTDSPQRRKLIRRMQDIFVDELPWIVESHRVGYTVTHAWLRNFKPVYMGQSTAKFLRVDLQRKEQGMTLAR